MTRTTILGVALAATFAFASNARAAAPNYILVSGPGVARPILLANWSQNGDLLSSLVYARRASQRVGRRLAHRPKLDLAEFWGWGGKPRPTRPSQANQHGSFYPASQGQPAVFVVMVNGSMVPRVAPARALRILARHVAPTRL